MLCPIVCNCGTPLAHLADAFYQARRERMAAALLSYSKKMKKGGNDGEDSEQSNKDDVELTEGNINMSYYLFIMEDIDMGDVLNALHITNMCCRTKMISHVKFNDM